MHSESQRLLDVNIYLTISTSTKETWGPCAVLSWTCRLHRYFRSSTLLSLFKQIYLIAASGSIFAEIREVATCSPFIKVSPRHRTKKKISLKLKKKVNYAPVVIVFCVRYVAAGNRMSDRRTNYLFYDNPPSWILALSLSMLVRIGRYERRKVDGVY